MNKKAIFTSAIITSAVLAILALGFRGGRYATMGPINKLIVALEKGQTLGLQLNEEEKSEALQAFYPESQDLKALDDYSWSPLCLLTPFVGSAPAPGQQNNAKINSMQFRDAREVTSPKPSGRYRVFLTGGSTAYGNGAPSDERTIAGYLEKALNDKLSDTVGKVFEVFTMASSAWASTHERIAIENLLSELEPDLIISLSGNNDVHWGVSGKNILWFRTYFDKNIFNCIKYIYSQSRGMNLRDNLFLPDPLPIAPPIVAKRLLKNVRLSVFALSPARTPYLFVLQPTLAAVSKPLTTRENRILQKRISQMPEHQNYFKSCYQAIDQALSSEAGGDLHYLNLANVFDDKAKEEIFIDSYHFGDRGNEIIALAIAQKIIKFSTVAQDSHH